MEIAGLMDAEKIILLVEDNSNDVLLMKRAFNKAKLVNPIVVASDGQEAVDYLEGAGKFMGRDRAELPVLMLLDLKLPKKNGLEVLEWVRSREGLKRLPVVVL
ncbi:MAG: response regulator, partial [Deltaproteobacteria bacterium]|nr:response regulator [Deltaproteobacteria bacterium]